MESIFRLFLAYGNEPLHLEELSRRLNDWRGGDSYRTSAEILSRLLENDLYYGLSQVEGQPFQSLPSSAQKPDEQG